jgi:glycosyltransferase involved in cell wall biosynthesis
MLVLRGDRPDGDVVKFDQNDNILTRQWNRLRNRSVTVSELRPYKKSRPPNTDIFSNGRSVYDTHKHPLFHEADIIHLHRIAGMVDCDRFFTEMAHKPIVWSLDDMNPFTGGCHYSGGCTKYETGCGACIQLGSKDPDDLSRKIFKKKEKAYRGHKIHIVAPSQWMASGAKKSLLFGNFKIDVIPHGVATSVFAKRDKCRSRDFLKLPQDKTLILFGAEYKVERKGFGHLLEALKLLQKRTACRNMALVVFGPRQGKYSQYKDIGCPIYSLGYIRREALLPAIYSSCELFVIPSLEEAFGQTCLESMSCGIPPIGFNTGGMVDMITPDKTGLLAELKNTEDLAGKIEYMITHVQEREAMGENARRLVEQEYTFEIQAKRYLKLYERAL